MTTTNDRTVFAEGYPPAHHMLRDLNVSLELKDTGPSIIMVPVVPAICTDRGGVQVGILATLIDILGGAVSIRAVDPDWAATADLTVHTMGRATSGRVSVTGSLLRAGNTMLVVELNILGETGPPPGGWTSIGGGWISFARLSRRDDTIQIDFHPDGANRYRFAVGGSRLRRPYLETIGARKLNEAKGVFELPLSDYLRNSFGALQGGIVAVLADASGQAAARVVTGRPMITRDLGIHYLSQGKTGPFRTEATVIRVTEDTALSRVEVIDTGADRVVALAMNTAIHGS